MPLNLGQLITEELPDQLVQRGRVGHVHAHRFLLVLEQDRSARVFEEDVVAGYP